MSTTRVRYSCTVCGVAKASVDVPARRDESVTQWMDAAVRVLAADHARRSPRCTAKKLASVMIPVSGTDRIGGPVLN